MRSLPRLRWVLNYALILLDGIVQQNTACLPGKVFHTEAELSKNPKGINMTTALNVSCTKPVGHHTPLGESEPLCFEILIHQKNTESQK